MSYRKKHINPKIKGLRKKTPMILRPWFWLAVLVVICAGGACYGLFFWQAVQVNNVQVQGNTTIASNEIQTAAWQNINMPHFMLPWKNILLVNDQGIEKNITKKFPEIATAAVQKKFFQTVQVTVQERQAVANFCNQTGQCFLIDATGVAFAVSSATQNQLPVITSAGDQSASLGEHAVDSAVMAAIVDVQKNLKDKSSIDVKTVQVGDTLVVVTTEGWKLYFDQNGDVAGQITRLNALLKEKLPTAARKNLEYIYLQYKDRAYYK